MTATRIRPLVAVVYRVPLFVEAMSAAFADLADVRGVRGDDAELDGLLRALRPDGIIVESAVAPLIAVAAPTVHVDLQARTVSLRSEGDEWRLQDVDVSGEAIRNVALSAMLIGSPA